MTWRWERASRGLGSRTVNRRCSLRVVMLMSQVCEPRCTGTMDRVLQAKRSLLVKKS